MQRQQHRRGNWSQVILWVGLAVVLIFGSVAIIVHEAVRPATSAARQTVAIARDKAGVNNIHEFATYNRKQTYYSVSGQDSKERPVYVVVAKSTGKVHVLKKSAGKTRQAIKNQVTKSAKPKKILNTALGYRHDQPVWEVSYLNKQGNLCYLLLRYQDGSTAQSIQNL